jgi:uncharacterized protein YggE
MTMPISRALFCAFMIAAAALAPFSAHAADKLEMLVTVSSQGKTARAASDANAKDMTVVLAAIKESGVADRDIQTTSLSLQPQYDPKQTGAARLIGFQVNNQVTIKIRDVGKLSAVLDRAIAAGANEMSGIEFVVSEQEKLLDQARAAAIADARHKAELYANAAAMKIGRVVAISEEGSVLPRPYQSMRAGVAPAIAPGEQTLRAVVTVSYELTS